MWDAFSTHSTRNREFSHIIIIIYYVRYKWDHLKETLRSGVFGLETLVVF